MSYAYQEEGITFLRNTPRAFLADDPGLGKTRQAILGSVGRTLVVAPAMLRGTWADEIALWADDADRFTWTSYHSSYERGHKPPRPRKEFRQPWDTVIFDECQHLKNPKAFWTRSASRLRSERSIFLTGTPVPNWAHELFIVLRMLHVDDVDRRAWASRWRWLEEWFHLWQPPWGGTQIKGLLAINATSSAKEQRRAWRRFYRGNDLDRLMLRRTRDEVLPELPPLTEQTLTVPMTTAQRRLYRSLKEQYLAWVEETGTEVSAFSSGGLHTKLAKIQTGIATVDPSVSRLESGKLDALRELLLERTGQPTLVVCHFQNTATAIGRLLDTMKLRWDSIVGGQAPKKREAAKTAFQAGQLNVLVGTLDSISEGLTLTRADCCIFVERSWKPYKNEQAMRRIHRIGQTRPVNIIYLLTEKAIDSRITKLLTAKNEQQEAFHFTAGQFAAMLRDAA